MNNIITTRKLTIINFVIIAYFVIIWVINYYHIDSTLVGVFREILTIPFLVAQLVFVILGIKHLLKKRVDFLFGISLLLLAISTTITLGSFFVN